MNDPIRDYLKGLYKEADERSNLEWHKAQLRGQTRNRRRCVARRVAGKASRERESPGLKAIPERVGAHRAEAMLHITQVLWAKVDLVKSGKFDELARRIRASAPDLGTARLSRKFEQQLEACMAEVFGRLSRLVEPAPVECPADLSKGWDAQGLYDALGLRAAALKKALPALALIQGHDDLAATIYLRDFARLAVLNRFLTSGHFHSKDRFEAAANVIGADADPNLVRSYGDVGRLAWRRAVEGLREELISGLD